VQGQRDDDAGAVITVLPVLALFLLLKTALLSPGHHARERTGMIARLASLARCYSSPASMATRAGLVSMPRARSPASRVHTTMYSIAPPATIVRVPTTQPSGPSRRDPALLTLPGPGSFPIYGLRFSTAKEFHLRSWCF